jgi:hypothetical protein
MMTRQDIQKNNHFDIAALSENDYNPNSIIFTRVLVLLTQPRHLSITMTPSNLNRQRRPSISGRWPFVTKQFRGGGVHIIQPLYMSMYHSSNIATYVMMHTVLTDQAAWAESVFHWMRYISIVAIENSNSG